MQDLHDSLKEGFRISYLDDYDRIGYGVINNISKKANEVEIITNSKLMLKVINSSKILHISSPSKNFLEVVYKWNTQGLGVFLSMDLEKFYIHIKASSRGLIIPCKYNISSDVYQYAALEEDSNFKFDTWCKHPLLKFSRIDLEEPLNLVTLCKCYVITTDDIPEVKNPFYYMQL